MTVKKCRVCGKENPPFFTHCVDCGTKLAAEPGKTFKIPAYLKPGLILVGFLILLFLVVPPLVQYSLTFGQDFSETVKPATGYPMNQMVGNNDLQITVISAREGQKFQNSYKFFIVSVSLKNVRSSGNIHVSNNDFEVIDTEGTKYIPYGIGSQVMYEISPSQSSTPELNFIIPQRVAVKRIRFTFPATSDLQTTRKVVEFDV